MKALFTIVFLFLSTISPAQLVHINVRAFAEGFYRSGTNSMVAVANPVNFPLMCDTVVFAFIDPMTNQPVYCSKIVLNTDGYGSDSVPANLVGQMLIPYVRFRNTLGIYSKNEAMIDLVTNDFDLTDTGFASTNCNRDNNIAKAYSGDMNGDGYIDGSDFVLIDFDNANGAAGYLVTDLNGDGFVDGIDFPIFDINSMLGLNDPFWFTCTLSTIGNVYHNQIHFEISPDPATEFVLINTVFMNSSFEVVIYNSTGAVIYSELFQPSSEIAIDVSEYLPGIYFLCNPATGHVGRFVKL